MAYSRIYVQFILSCSGLVFTFALQKVSTNYIADLIQTAPSYSPVVVEQPFTAFWNVPSYNCSHLFNISLSLERYGIVANKAENFTGEEVVIFYADQFGYYPFIKENTSFNGGLPQVADLDAHIEKATEDVLSKIPNPAYDGIAILDWESWRPQWSQNFDTREVYRKWSIQLVRERHPEWNNDTVELVAILEFEQAAKQFMESSLRLVTELRPRARWGFYHFPYCYNGAKEGRVCSTEAVTSNDNITWLFDASTALYPSIYLNGGQNETSMFVEGVATEAMRVRKGSRNPRMDIYLYTRYVYKRSGLYLTKEDLNNTILQPANMGMSGVVFWGSQADYHTAESCSDLQSYIKQFLGPFVKNVTDASFRCSELLCSGHGRCKGDIMACAGSLRKEALSKPYGIVRGRSYHKKRKGLLFPCTCECYKGYYGVSCSQQTEVVRSH